MRLDLCLAAVRGGCRTAYDVAHELPWTRHARTMAELDLFNSALATLEALAHLELLAARGDVARTEVAGILEFRPPASWTRRIGTCGMPSSRNSGPVGS